MSRKPKLKIKIKLKIKTDNPGQDEWQKSEEILEKFKTLLSEREILTY
jgi:hypothetical protein